jgi:hypothetical protein
MIIWLKPFQIVSAACGCAFRYTSQINLRAELLFDPWMVDLAILSGFASANAKIEPMTSRQISV